LSKHVGDDVIYTWQNHEELTALNYT